MSRLGQLSIAFFERAHAATDAVRALNAASGPLMHVPFCRDRGAQGALLGAENGLTLSKGSWVLQPVAAPA